MGSVMKSVSNAEPLSRHDSTPDDCPVECNNIFQGLSQVVQIIVQCPLFRVCLLPLFQLALSISEVRGASRMVSG